MTNRLRKKWTVFEESDEAEISRFSKETNIPYPLSKILINRNICTKSDTREFFIPELKNLHNPFLMKDMEKACSRLLKVIENKEKILVLGDYDVDGTSGVSMFHLFLKELNVPNSVYIPDRFTEGYGLSKEGIDFAAKESIKLILAIDCGITAYDKVEYANSLSIDVIICDHHQPPEAIPRAYAVLDALQLDCSYPFKNLCGTGVAFKLIQAICERTGSDLHFKLLDFVAVATAADMVTVTGENRILVHNGFKQIKENPRPSFLAIIRNSGIKFENINTSNVVFSLGPRINAVGRLGDATRAVEFLTCDDLSKVESLAGVLETENTNRKKIDSETYLQAQHSYENYRSSADPHVNDIAIVLHNPDWHPGVLGIIASRMAEKYYRPSIILTTFNGNAKGSARSINNFNIYDALKRCSEECSGLIQFGGHYHAAGLEIEVNKVEEFRNTFNKIARNIIASSSEGEKILVPEIKIDTQLDIDEVSSRFIKILRHFEPFGPGNMTPVFLSRNLQVVGDPRVFNQQTSVFKVRNSHADSYSNEQNVFECVFYQSPSLEESDKIEVKTGDRIDIVYSIEENHWNEKTKTQLRIRDIKPAMN